MTDFKIIKTEYAHGSLNGVDYGSQVRVLMRSAIAILYVAYGLNGTKRNSYHWNNIAIAPDAKRATLERPDIRAKIVALFGEGADEAALATTKTRGMATALFDGGGDPLPLPNHVQRANGQARYASATATRRAYPVGKTCLQCGEPLKIDTVRHFLGYELKENHPRTIEDCQRLTNELVVAVHGYDIRQDKDRWPLVERFETWDGESYDYDTFCSDQCAATYGRRAAAELPTLPVGGTCADPRHLRHRRAHVDHYEPKTDMLGRFKI